MLNVFYVVGEVLLILALLGLIGVLIWFVLTVLHVKNTTVGHAKRLSQRPISAVKNLVTTVKGLVQQETVRGKRIGASVKETIGAVRLSADEIKEAAQAVHPEELKPAVSSLQSVTRIVGLAAQFAQSVGKQKAR
ncbi:MAG: hypothetical protein M3Y13_11330 [Armatimonadota bacterium]|nr:hypothetical protein [Armatimonadota bacterium]